MDIKSKIASFEAHNQAIRTSEKPSPKRDEALDTSTSSSIANIRRERIQPPKHDEALDTSTSSSIANLRRERLQREANDSPVRQVRKQPPAPSSLAERRKARQFQKQKRMVRDESASPANNVKTSSSRRASSRNAPLEQAPPHQSRSRSSSVQSNQSSEQMTSNRRYVHSLSMESSNSYEEHLNREKGMEDVPLSPERRLSPAKAAKVHRMHRRKQQKEGRLDMPPAMPDFDQNPLSASPGEPTDDEVTLTSVRQIMQAADTSSYSIARTASSSSIETDGATDQQRKMPPNTSSTQAFLSRSALGGGVADDERTFEPSEGEASVTYEQRKEAERRRAKQAKGRKDGFVDDTNSPLLNTEDVNYFQQTLNTPAAKITAGILAAGTVGCVVLGPVGLLVGAAVVGIGVGVMQIPEEQRSHVKDKAVKAAHRAHDSAVQASEALSASCAAGCHDLGVSEHFPKDVKEFFDNPGANAGAQDESSLANGAGPGVDRSGDNPGSVSAADGRKPTKLTAHSPSKMGKRRAACLRNARIVPLDQIHSLEPSLQPRAWLDVMASANTTREEKNEGMEEILILAKDKKHARFFLEEGILDSIMFIITGYVDGDEKESPEEFHHAKLAAQCAVTLGKAHCAAVHTGGDLQLMSLYGERGMVPEERQLAQMLYENPHHVQVALSSTEDIFVLKQIPMAQAEELARSIMGLAGGAIKTP